MSRRSSPKLLELVCGRESEESVSAGARWGKKKRQRGGLQHTYAQRQPDVRALSPCSYVLACSRSGGAQKAMCVVGRSTDLEPTSNHADRRSLPLPRRIRLQWTFREPVPCAGASLSSHLPHPVSRDAPVCSHSPLSTRSGRRMRPSAPTATPRRCAETLYKRLTRIL